MLLLRAGAPSPCIPFLASQAWEDEELESMKDGQVLLVQQETPESGRVLSNMVGISAGGRACASGIAVGHVPGCSKLCQWACSLTVLLAGRFSLTESCFLHNVHERGREMLGLALVQLTSTGVLGPVGW